MKPKTVKKADGKPKKEKSQSKRMKTFSSSEFSLWEQKNKALHASATDLTILRNEAAANRRAQNNSALSQHGSSKIITPKPVAKKKKKVAPNKPKSKIRKIEQQQFEKAKYKQSNSQSQIVFSNDETKRESCIALKDVKHIQSINNYEADSNLVLRVNIKKQYIRKVEAATKIQKVFRGFMTRKILLKYIMSQEERLRNRIVSQSNHNDSQDFRQNNETHRTFVDKESDCLVNRLFQNKGANDVNFNHTIRARVQDFQTSSENSDHENYNASEQFANQKIIELLGQKLSERENKKSNRSHSWMERENKEKDKNRQQQQEQNEQQQSSSEQEDDGSNAIYKRQNPIYSQEEISQYLESSSEQESEIDEYEPDIIFETNEEYIESRKSSLQNKNETINKLSNRGVADLAIIMASEDKIRKQLRSQQNKLVLSKRNQFEDQGESQTIQQKKNIAPAQTQEQDHVKQTVEIKQQPIEETKIYDKTLKAVPQQYQTIEVNHQQKSQKSSNSNTKLKRQQNNQQLNPAKQTGPQNQLKIKESSSPNQKLLFSPRREVRYLDEQDYIENSNQSQSNKSKASIQQKEIVKLRQQECEKWDQVIKMVSEQIKKNEQNNGEMVNFMKNIMQLSQKNKQLLGSTRSVISQSDAFTTPTSMGIYKSIEVKDGSKSVELPVSAERQEFLQKQENQNSAAFKFFKKKKPLKIDIIDSNFLKQQKQSLIPQKSEQKNSRPAKFAFSIDSQFMRSKRKNKQEQEQSSDSIEKFKCKRKEPVEQSRNQFEENIETSKTLKKFLSSNIQVQDEAIYDILRLREELLQKRESEELINLNKQLSKNELSQQKFLEKLSGLTGKFVQQKEAIDKAKDDILKGYQAANNLVKEYFFDVRRMGIKMTVSKSQDNLKYKFSQPSLFNSDIQIDELTPKSTPKSGKKVSIKQIFADHEIEEEKKQQRSANVHYSGVQSSEDSSLDFTEQELKRFRKAASYDLEFNDLNRNMTTISEEFIKQQKRFQNQNEAVSAFNESPDNKIFNRSSAPQRQTYMLEDSKVPSARTPPHIEAIIQAEITMLAWQFAAELTLKPEMSQKFLQKPSLIRPAEISNRQRLQFFRILQQNLPDRASLYKKLNQNITPLPSEILKCMRLDFSEEPQNEQEDADYEQINRYEFVISQESCARSVTLFKNSLDQAQQRKQIEQIKQNNELIKVLEQNIKSSPAEEKIQKFIHQREKFIKSKKQHTYELRWEVMNIELHCIFDSWNQEIIQICSLRSGFSGIGLNELTLSMINHNKPVAIEKCQNIIAEAKDKVIEILHDDSDINAKILRENFHEMCENDSAWIFYADQALSYGLELVYLVEEDIYSEFAKQLRKFVLKNSF